RGGRYVVPVKAEYRGAVKGIVHDQSASGQTVFIEPLEILEANNVLREAELAERSEVVRILDELSRRVERAADDLEAVTTALGALDLALAKAFYAEALEASRPALNADRILDLIDARHPLLVEQGSVVGIDVRLGDDALPGAQSVRVEHAGSAQREHGVRRGDTAADVPAAPRSARRVERLRHRRASRLGPCGPRTGGRASLGAASVARANAPGGRAT